MDFEEIHFQSQVGSLPEASKYVSLLITNENLIVKRKIEKFERKAIYDGVIALAEELVFFIETKPNLNNVWEDQLCPAIEDIPEDAELVPQAVVLQWKETIDMLHRINKNPSTAYSEKLLIDDFFAFINLNFDYLNPYNDFSKCHSNYLAQKRIEQILSEIAVRKDTVAFHQGWGWHIQLELQEVKKLALLLDHEPDKEWEGITIACEFASTVSQGRRFYTITPTFDVISNLDEWGAYPNFHLAFRDQNLIFLKSPPNSEQTYFQYWKNDVWGNFGGVLKAELIENYLNDFIQNGLIVMDNEKQLELEQKVMSKGYQRINIRPAIYMEHCISK